MFYNPGMAKLEEIITSAEENHQFVGTIAFKSEEITLPDGSTMALGIDCGHWVLVYQRKKGAAFVVYDYDSDTKAFRADKMPGTRYDFQQMRQLIKYFFASARDEDLVTILPPGSAYE